jgi:trimethylamine:corrinoid methyltransferase-like protein
LSSSSLPAPVSFRQQMAEVMIRTARGEMPFTVVSLM